MARHDMARHDIKMHSKPTILQSHNLTTEITTHTITTTTPRRHHHNLTPRRHHHRPEAKRPLHPIDVEYLSCECRKYYSYLNGTKDFVGKNVFVPGATPKLTFDIAEAAPTTAAVCASMRQWLPLPSGCCEVVVITCVCLSSYERT
jgi:hypothetical protein